MKTIKRLLVAVGWVSLMLTAVWAYCYVCYNPEVYGWRYAIFHLPWKITLFLSLLILIGEDWFWNLVGKFKSSGGSANSGDLSALGHVVVRHLDPTDAEDEDE